jgi:hypothetical protein
MTTTTTQRLPWWTPADQAELDLLAFEFVRAARVHRLECLICLAGGPWCPRLAEAFAAVLEWRDGRELRSRAAWLRKLVDDFGPAATAAASRETRAA